MKLMRLWDVFPHFNRYDPSGGMRYKAPTPTLLPRYQRQYYIIRAVKRNRRRKASQIAMGGLGYVQACAQIAAYPALAAEESVFQHWGCSNRGGHWVRNY